MHLLVDQGAIIVLLFISKASSQQKKVISDVSDYCLQCIARASNTENNNNCFVDEDSGETCGIHGVTYDFWKDAGNFTVDGSQSSGSREDFRNCGLASECSAKTVRAYMGQFYRDCNGDGMVTCEDFDRIHYKGPHSCIGDDYEDTSHYFTFIHCLNEVPLICSDVDYCISQEV